MAGLGINLSSDASLKDVLEGKPLVATHHKDFSPQGNAFRDSFAKDNFERYEAFSFSHLYTLLSDLNGFSVK